MTQQRDLEIRQQQDQREIGAEKNLRFKEKAVAEAAALLIAKKTIRLGQPTLLISPTDTAKGAWPSKYVLIWQD